MIYFHKKQNLIETKNKNSICVIHPMITKKHNERLFSAMNFHTHFKKKLKKKPLIIIIGQK